MKRFILIFFILVNAHVTVYSQDYLQMMQMMQMMQDMQINNMINSAINNFKTIQTRIGWSPANNGVDFHLYYSSISNMKVKLTVNRKDPNSSQSYITRTETTNGQFSVGAKKEGADLEWKIEPGDKITWYVNDQYEGSYTFPDDQSRFNALAVSYKNEFESLGNSLSTMPSSPVNTFSTPSPTPSSSSSSGYVICKSCKGTGKCGTCSGSGYYQGSYGTGTLKCPNCSERDGRICSVCNGTGKWFLK